MIGFKYVFLSLCIIELIVGFRDDLFTDSDFDEDDDDYDSENSVSDALFDLAGDVLTTGAHMFSSFMKEVGEQFERCEFSCPNLKKPKHRENYEPTFNGCGSYGYTINLLPGFTACCNVHDICYGTCNKRKLDCDAKFKKCLLSVCNDNALSSIDDLKDIISACNSTATLMYDLVIKFGCPAYGSSQKLACDCS